MKKWWKYKVISRTGEEIVGCSEGELIQVKERLAGWKGQVFSIEFDYAGFLKQINLNRSMTPEVLAEIFEDMANMQKAGLTPAAMISAIRQSALDKQTTYIFDQVQADLLNGQSLAVSLAKVKVFPWIIGAAVFAGERTGKLKDVFMLLAENFRFTAQLKGRLQEALFYPAIVFLLLFTLIISVSCYVVPRLSSLLSADVFNHFPANFLIGFSHVLMNYWFMIIMCLILVWVMVFSMVREHKDKVDDVIYRMPLIGGLFKAYYLAFYFNHLQLLLNSGISLIDALNDLYVRTPGKMGKHFLGCREYMLGGLSFWESLRMDDFFPSIVVLSMAKAEETTQLGDYCGQLGAYYQKRFQQDLNCAMSFVQPALLLVAGGFLILIAAAFLMPIYGSLSRIAGG